MTCKKITVIEVSECFPNKFKPVTGEFILQHVRALSKYCNVITLVPIRYVPSKELFSFNPVKSIRNLSNWYSSLWKTKSYSEGNLNVIYFPYISMPRPYFEFMDDLFIKFFFYNKVKGLLKNSGPDIIYCHWLKPWSKISKKLADHFNIPLIIDHHEDIPTLKKLFPDDYLKFLKVFEKADRIIVHSKLNKEDLLNENLNLPEITVNYLGQNFLTDEKIKIFNFNKIKLVCVSHLYERRKNIDVLIKAMSLLDAKPGIKLTIVGEGNLKQEYVDLTKELSLSVTIHFTGAKTQEELEAILDSSDIFILPSYPEAFGIVFIEALAKGLPVITCIGNGGGEELKALGYEIILVKPDSPIELSNAILKLAADRNKLSSMSQHGKEIVKKYFSWDENAKNTYEILKKTLLEHNSKSQCPE